MAEQTPEPLKMLTDREATRAGRDVERLAQSMLRMGELARYIEAHNRMLSQAESERSRVGDEMSELQAERANLKKIVAGEIAAEREKRIKPLETRVRNLNNDVSTANDKLNDAKRLTTQQSDQLRQIQVDIGNMTETRDKVQGELQTTTQMLRENKVELNSVNGSLATAKLDLQKLNSDRQRIQKEFNDWQRLVEAVNS